METLKKYAEGVKGLIFDYGGTLDTGGTHWSWVLWQAWQKAGVAATLPIFREAYVYAERELARVESVLPEHDFAAILHLKANIALQWLAGQGQFPAAEVAPAAEKIAAACDASARESVKKSAAVLEALAPRYPMVVVSNFYGNLSTVLKEYGILHFFRKVVESAREGIRKPDPEIFRRGVMALGLQAGECLVIGDSYTKDIVPALEAGCKAVWLKGRDWDGRADIEDYPASVPSIESLPDFLL